MRLRKEPAIQVKSPEQIDRMYAAGQVVAHTLSVLKDAVRPGVTTAELDSIAEREIRAAGAVPSFLGYSGYPASICTSVNEQVVHGIPSTEQVLKPGDVISIDCGAILDGWHGDSAVSVGVGEIDPADQALINACRASMWAGIAQAVAGLRLSDISHAVEESVRGSGDYGLIREYTGHGIGTEMHMDPVVRNYGPPGQGPARWPLTSSTRWPSRPTDHGCSRPAKKSEKKPRTSQNWPGLRSDAPRSPSLTAAPMPGDPGG